MQARAYLGSLIWRTFIIIAVVGMPLSLPAQQLSTPPASAASANDGQWTMPAKNVASMRFSVLDEITPESVKSLQVAFTFSLDVDRGQESAPLVVDNTLLVVSPSPNNLCSPPLRSSAHSPRRVHGVSRVPASSTLLACRAGA